MKTIAFVCAALTLLAATASAGDLAVSKSTLNHMGLGGMQQMSDTDGMAVRGKAVFATVGGSSFASWLTVNGLQTSTNSFAAGAEWLGPVGASAQGQSLSFAGVIGINFAADPTGFLLTVQAAGGVSGGGASASAF